MTGITKHYGLLGASPAWETTGLGTQNQQTLTYAQDGTGNITGLIGALQGGGFGYTTKFNYDAFGNVKTTTPTGVAQANTSGPRYRSEYYDAGTDQIYLRNRYYSPGTGRFNVLDPAGSPDGPNRYLYCGSEPVNCSDPMGTDYIKVAEGKAYWVSQREGLAWNDDVEEIPLGALVDNGRAIELSDGRWIKLSNAKRIAWQHAYTADLTSYGRQTAAKRAVSVGITRETRANPAQVIDLAAGIPQGIAKVPGYFADAFSNTARQVTTGVQNVEIGAYEGFKHAVDHGPEMVLYKPDETAMNLVRGVNQTAQDFYDSSYALVTGKPDSLQGVVRSTGNLWLIFEGLRRPISHFEDLETSYAATENVVVKSGGRRGSSATRDHLDEVRDQFLDTNPDYRHVAGGRDRVSGAPLPEEYLPGPGGGRTGSSYPDLTFEGPGGDRVRINTVDTKATGDLTLREQANFDRIFELTGGETIIGIPKRKQKTRPAK